MSTSPSEIKYIRQGCATNFRLDGRSNTHYRPYTLLIPSSSSSSCCSPILSNASSRLFLPASNTDILCSIKAELVRPPMLMNRINKAETGVIDLNVDILPYASTFTDRRDIKKEEQEVTSILTHLILPPFLMHGKKEGGGGGENHLVVKEGKYVWRLNIDVMVIHCDGNLVDCCSMVIFGALQNLKLPRVMAVEHAMEHENDSGVVDKSGGKRASDELMLDSDVANSVKLDNILLDHCPIVVTLCLMPVVVDGNIMDDKRLRKKNDCVMVVDADRQEEMASSSKVSVSIDRKGNICGIHKYGTSSVLGGYFAGGNIKLDMLSKIQDIAASCSKTVFSIILNPSNHKHGKGEAAAATAAALWLNGEDEYTNFFKSQFELQ